MLTNEAAISLRKDADNYFLLAADSTGLYSVYAQYQDCEIMFHVSTLLPFTPNNRQQVYLHKNKHFFFKYKKTLNMLLTIYVVVLLQLLRKRHIGNDIVTIVFQEPGAQPFTPKNIRSQFQHVFIVVQAVNPCSENTQYRYVNQIFCSISLEKSCGLEVNGN